MKKSRINPSGIDEQHGHHLDPDVPVPLPCQPRDDTCDAVVGTYQVNSIQEGFSGVATTRNQQNKARARRTAHLR